MFGVYFKVKEFDNVVFDCVFVVVRFVVFFIGFGDVVGDVCCK